MDRATTLEKPRQSLAGLWNISFGFFGIQIGFALQNANMSRIFQTLGSSLDDLPWLWADSSDLGTIDIAGLPPGPHKVKIELVDTNHAPFPGQVATVTFDIPAAQTMIHKN